MNDSHPDKKFLEEIEKYTTKPDFLEGVDFGPCTLESHLASPEVSYEAHRCRKELECAELVASRTVFYLDTRFWINLREADLGRSAQPIFTQLLTEFRKGVSQGKVLCPFAADTLAEVYKQSDTNTRLATARLIDELSLRIALQSEPERIDTELHHGIQNIRKSGPQQQPLKKLVWTFSSYAIGHCTPVDTAFDDVTELAIQKSFLDTLSQLGFAQQVSASYDELENSKGINEIWSNLAKRINQINLENSKNQKSRKQIELEEFSGCLEFHLPSLANAVHRISESTCGEASAPETNTQIGESVLRLAGIIVERFRQNSLKGSFPSFCIRAGIATAMRWDQRRNYEENDFHDFGHAVAALPYFDVFATEKSLRHLLVTELKYDKKFSTVIECQPAAILNFLQRL